MPSISEKDLKLLWGRASGRCSYCNLDLTLELGTVETIGEMAHIIAKEEGGPRGSETIDPAKRNSYENLILLCPTHHRMIDKAPNDYTVEQILGWKRSHERRIEERCEGERLPSKSMVCEEIVTLLDENYSTFITFGPESKVALRNPLSETSKIWEIQKVSIVVPNNQRIVAIFEANSNFFEREERAKFLRFREHSVAFEQNAYERLDRESVPTFPDDFREMVEKGINSGESTR